MADEKSWTVNYLPMEGGRLTGTLTVTDDEVHFVTMYDSSNANVVKGVLGGLTALAGHGSIVEVDDDGSTHATVRVDRNEITQVTAAKRRLTREVHVALSSGDVLRFNYGMLSVAGIVAALQPGSGGS